MWLNSAVLVNWCKNFYSHIPCGMWLLDCAICSCESVISTHTSRVGCDTSSYNSCLSPLISTHTSRVGCDKNGPVTELSLSDFYSHIPCGMWLVFRELAKTIETFLLTHPVWDVTGITNDDKSITGISTHTSRVGCDYGAGNSTPGKIYFYSHIPCGMWLVPAFI